MNSKSENNSPRLIRTIAAEIQKTWSKVSPYAEPYLEAMLTLDTIEDNYFFDDGKSIVLYFLANASGWRGEDARIIKKELRDICGLK